MRRDICQFYPRGVHEVFDAYVAAAHDRFDKECKAEPYYSITFGLNFSFKYNMNGGACTVHFMPYNGGTVVNVRYSIAQGAGARYGAHNRDLTKVVESRLGCMAQEADIDVEEFLKPENQIIGRPVVPAYEIVPETVSQTVGQPAAQYEPQAQTQPHPQPQPYFQPMYAAEPQQPAYNTVSEPEPIYSAAPAAETAFSAQTEPQPLEQNTVRPAYDIVPDAPVQAVGQPMTQNEPQTQPAPVMQPTHTAEVGDTCKYCGEPIRPNAKFCYACGKPIAPPKCPNCGETVEPIDKFCFNCGTKLK